MLQQCFELDARGTDVRTEVIAGLTTFLTMAYIVFVNPAMLAETGMDHGAVFVATCLAAAIGSALMGLLANHPIALAPGMGLNAYFTYAVVLGAGHSWQAALGAVFVAGLLFVLLGLVGVRGWVIRAIPRSQRLGISAGIGWFLALIALKNAEIVVASPATLVTLGDVTAGPVLLAGASVVLTLGLVARGITGAVMIGILATTAVALLTGMSSFAGVMSTPPSVAPTLLQMDVMAALDPAMLGVVMALLFVDLFDTSGTLLGVAQRGGLLDEDGELPRLERAMTADSVATVAGAALGTSTVTSYVESAAGVAAGGRTGLTAVVVALCFLAALVLAPLARSVPAFATTGALLYVAVLMTRALGELEEDLTEAAPAVVVALGIPLSFSIAHGIGLGVITYVATKAIAGRGGEVGAGTWLLAVVFAAEFALG